jgi:hypothetical protein
VSPSQKLYPRPQGLAGYLERMPQLRPALSQARASMRSEHLLKQCLPAIILPALHSIHSSGSSVVISVNSAEAAHMLRLLRPELERTFAAKGLKFNEIVLSVQSKVVPKRRVRALPSTARIQELSDCVTQVESKRLQTSLEKLARTLTDATDNG